ncbi:MAG: transcriptional regulator [Deltaproteobacteria bacterium]|nr:transcriptional regulator [Deltaproteobacteria bacterium]
MPRILFFLAIGYVLYRLVKTLFRKRMTQPSRRTGDVETFRDPVCGVYVTSEDAVIARLNGEKIHFCSTECLEKYRQDSENTSPHADESGGSK